MFTCPTNLVALPESAPFPTDLICVYQVASDGAPQITLKVGDDGSESAHTKASDYPTTPVLDEVQRDATNRNDRPGKSNQLIFLFSLNIWQPAFGQSYPDPARAHRLVKSRGSLRCELANIQMPFVNQWNLGGIALRSALVLDEKLRSQFPECGLHPCSDEPLGRRQW